MENRTATIVLAVFLGWLGVHRFYLGHQKLGVLYLLTFWTGIPWLISWVEALFFLAIGEDDFNERYNSAPTTRSQPASAPADDSFEWDIENVEARQRQQEVYNKHFDIYINAYHKAEKLRKQGDAAAAAPLYEKALEHVEKSQDPSHPFPPAPYREYAKMLYHMGEDERAVEVLDRHGEMQRLRERLATGDFRRLKNKYQ